MSAPLILYVDDERANRIVFEHAFSQKFNVRCVSSGEEALVVLKEQAVAVLVTDQRMPGMSGHELLQAARTLYPEVTRVIITAYGDLDQILRAVNEGLVSRYLVKPWDRKELEQILTWGIEAADLARRDSALQLRLMETERLVTIGSISSAVLHDLQQPIASLGLNVDLVAQHVRALNEARGTLVQAAAAQPAVATALTELPDLVEDLRLAANVMQGIVEHLRTFLRQGTGGDAGAPRADAAGIEPLPVIRYALSVCRHAANKKLAQVSYEGPTELPRVKMGLTELTQVLINLLSNAVIALPERGRADISARVEGDVVRFAVVDTGGGMPAEVLRKAGTAFFTTRPQGTGLGLSQCHRLLGAFGATLELDSKVGVGTTARFALSTVA